MSRLETAAIWAVVMPAMLAVTSLMLVMAYRATDDLGVWSSPLFWVGSLGWTVVLVWWIRRARRDAQVGTIASRPAPPTSP